MFNLINKNMKNFFYAVFIVMIITSCMEQERQEQSKIGENFYNTDTIYIGIIDRELFTQRTYYKKALKYVRFKDKKIGYFIHPEDELILARKGDTVFYKQATSDSLYKHVFKEVRVGFLDVENK